jgi:hypothetical protein
LNKLTEPSRLHAALCLTIFSALLGIIISAAGVGTTNAQEQEQQQLQPIATEMATDNFTLNINILGINRGTRNSTISVSGPEGESLTGNTTIDLFSRAQQEIASKANPVALTVPIIINSSLIHDRDELRICLTMLSTGKVDCEVTVITSYNMEGFPKSVPLEAGRSIEQQIRELSK